MKRDPTIEIASGDPHFFDERVSAVRNVLKVLAYANIRIKEALLQPSKVYAFKLEVRTASTDPFKTMLTGTIRARIV